MTDESTQPTRDKSIARRRRLLYAAAFVGFLLVAAVAARSIFSGDDKDTKTPVKLTAPVIVERIQLKPVGSSSGRGLAEVLRRGNAESLRVLVAELKPTANGQIYQLVLTGGPKDEKLLGNEAVGKQKIFVGEAKLPLETLHSYRRIELRLVTNGDPPDEALIVRGKIPR
jgi:hypothetical protein